jgi:hypothetical protein
MSESESGYGAYISESGSVSKTKIRRRNPLDIKLKNENKEGKSILKKSIYRVQEHYRYSTYDQSNAPVIFVILLLIVSNSRML